MGLTLVNDAPFCSLVVRALARPALMTPFPTPYSTSICGSCVSSRPPLFLLSAGITILVLVTAHETKPAWYSSFLPGWYTINTGRCLSEDAIERCISVVTRCTSPLRMVWGVHVLSRMFLLYFVYWLPTSRGPTLALQSLTLSTWRQHFRVERLLNPPSGVLIVSARKTGVVSHGS